MPRVSMACLLVLAIAAQALGDGPERLTLAEASRRALAGSAGAGLARTGPRAARAALAASLAAYDPRISASAGRQVDRTDRLSPIFGTDVRTDRLGIGLDWEAPTGTMFGLHLDTSRVSSDSRFVTIDPAWESRLALDIAQPLSGNVWGARTRQRINARRAEQGAEEADAGDRVEDSLAQAQVAYWELARAGEAVRLSEEALGRATALLTSMRARKALGTAEEQDVLAVQAHVLRAQSGLAATRADLASAGRRLRLAMGEDPADPVEAADALEGAPAPPEVPAEVPPAVRSAGLRLDARTADLAVTRRGRGPQVDLVVSLSVNGIDDDQGTTLGEAIRGEYPAAFLGIRVSAPWHDRSTRASVEAARAAQEAAAILLADAVRHAAAARSDAGARTALWAERYALADSVADVARLKLAAEQADFEVGRFDSDRLIRFEEEWIEARGERLAALMALAVARVEDARTHDTLLAAWGGRP